MQINKTSFAVGAGSIVLLGAALLPGLAGAQTGDATPTPSTTAEAGLEEGACGFGLRSLGGLHGPGGLHVGDDLAAILGVTAEDLQAAAETAKESFADAERPTTEEEREARQAEVQAAFASALGVSVADLEAATEQLKAEKLAELIAHVNEKVADGTLTQAEADVIIERIETGERPFEGRRGPGGRGFRGFEGFSGFGGFGGFDGFGGDDVAVPVTPDA